MPAHGRFWIDPSNGSVLISELDRRRRRRDRDGDGQLSIGAADGLSWCRSKCASPTSAAANAFPATPTYGKFRPIQKCQPLADCSHATIQPPLDARAGFSGTEVVCDGSVCIRVAGVTLAVGATFAKATAAKAPPTPLPADLQAIKITTTGTLTPQYALVHLFAEQGFKGYALVDSAGRIAWHYRTKDYPFGADRRKNGNFVFMDKGHGLVEVDRAGAIVHELKQRDAENEMHHAHRRDAARHGPLSRVRHRRTSPASG